jgi:tRNA threonylcarbamoyladenosine biosynthesis protein TsaE
MAGVKKYMVREEEALGEVARNILETHPDKRIFLFFGELGAGKTSLIKRFCSLLAVEDTVQSPTFSIVNEYATREGGFVYHMDFYRIEDVREARDIGLEEYLYSGSYCFIEWPAKMGYVPEEAVAVKIAVLSDRTREITVGEVEEAAV